MKNLRITFLVVFLFGLSSAQIRAYDIFVGGIYYNFDGNSLSVTYGQKLYSGEVVIPETVVYNGTEYKVTSIGVRAFQACENLTAISIPSTITLIGSGAFYQCKNINKVIVKDIGAWCNITFDDTPSYNNLPLYSDENTMITSLVIPQGVKTINKSAFSEYSGLTSVVIPNSVTYIGVRAFQGCYNLTSISIPDSVNTIDKGAFSGCGITSLDIPGSVTSIGESAMSDGKTKKVMIK